MRLLRRIAREQRGAMAITVGLLFPALLGFGVLAVDVGNWYVHKRELQTQADAAALAGAATFKYPCDNAPISAAAQSYAGKDHNVFANVPAARSHLVLNQPNFSGQSKPGDTGLSGNPCNDGAVDVKMTEKNVPWIFGKLFTPFINAQARVSILQQTTADNVEALAVADSAPVAARAYFVNEDNNDAIITSAPLNDLGPNAQGQEMWGNPSGLAVAMNKTNGSTANIGVVIALSGNTERHHVRSSVRAVLRSELLDRPEPAAYPRLVCGRDAEPDRPARPIRRSVRACRKHVQRCLLLEHHDHVHRNHLRVGGLRLDQHERRHRQAGGRWIHRERIDARGDQRQRGSMDRDDLAQTSRSEPRSTCSSPARRATAQPVARARRRRRRSPTFNVRTRPVRHRARSRVPGSRRLEVRRRTRTRSRYASRRTPAGCTHNLAVTINVAASLQNSQHFADPTYPIRIGTSQGNVVGCGANRKPVRVRIPAEPGSRDAPGRSPSILRIQPARPRGPARMTA